MKTGLRFDHREIAVILSLFVFVSLFMFTVGILVGKGLTQARYESALIQKSLDAAQDDAPARGTAGHEDTGHKEGAHGAPKGHGAGGHGGEGHSAPAGHGDAHGGDHSAVTPKPAELHEKAAELHGDSHDVGAEKIADARPVKEKELELIPLRTQKSDWDGTSLKNQKFSADEAEKLLQNPKIRALTESDEGPALKSRELAAKTEPAPKNAKTSKRSSPAGDFTVQVGSYPNAQDAQDRVKRLKELGFSHAYFSANQLGDEKTTWYRVWLGYYPDYASAKESGESLQGREEIKNFLVRKTETNHGTN